RTDGRRARAPALALRARCRGGGRPRLGARPRGGRRARRGAARGRASALRPRHHAAPAPARLKRASLPCALPVGGFSMPRKGSVPRVCLAYSGGLDTSVILRWLLEEYGCEVVAFCADVGQEEELSGLPDKAKATGAVDCVVRDVREEFVRDFVFPA